MNLKKTAIALAVAGMVGTPLAAIADGSVYASARIGWRQVDNGDGEDATMNIVGHASRFGMKGETDLGNGMSGWGKYEFSVATEGDGPNVGRRHAVVGIKGDFGNIFLGQTYHTYYNLVSGVSDYPWWNTNDPFYVGRTAQGLSYAGEFGAVSVGATIYMGDAGNGSTTDLDSDTEDDIDRTEFAVRTSFGDVGVGLGVISRSDDEATPADEGEDSQVGIAVEVPVGPVDLRANFTSFGDDSGIHIYAGFGNFYIDFGSADLDATDNSPNGVTLGYTHSIGPRTTAWFEFNSSDSDTDADEDANTRIHAVLKYDIL